MKKALATIFCLTFFLSASGEEVKTPDQIEGPILTAAEVLTIKDDDIVLGNRDASVVLFDYSSVTCTHCAQFDRSVFPKIKEEFIDTGKIAYVKRLIPSNAPALKTSMFLSCVEDKEVQYKVIKTLLKYQQQWLFDKDSSYMDKLKYFALLSGVDSDDFGRCVSDVDLGKQIYNDLIREAKAINLGHSPSFYINGLLYQGRYEFDDMKQYIESYLSTTGSAL